MQAATEATPSVVVAGLAASPGNGGQTQGPAAAAVPLPGGSLPTITTAADLVTPMSPPRSLPEPAVSTAGAVCRAPRTSHPLGSVGRMPPRRAPALARPRASPAHRTPARHAVRLPGT